MEFSQHLCEVWKDKQTCSPDASAFLVGTSSTEIIKKALQAWSSGHSDPEETWKLASEMVRNEINVSTHRRPEWELEYSRLVKVQQQIDDLKANGKKVPLALIENPFLRQYLKDKGQSE